MARAQSLLEDGHFSEVHRQGRMSSGNGKRQGSQTEYVPTGQPRGRARREESSRLALGKGALVKA